MGPEQVQLGMGTHLPLPSFPLLDGFLLHSVPLSTVTTSSTFLLAHLPQNIIFTFA